MFFNVLYFLIFQASKNGNVGGLKGQTRSSGVKNEGKETAAQRALHKRR
jgi:hypothetical protein